MISETKLHFNTLWDKKYPAQMLEVTGDLHQAWLILKTLWTHADFQMIVNICIITMQD